MTPLQQTPFSGMMRNMLSLAAQGLRQGAALALVRKR
jgi:hypothetical protein